MADAVGWLWSPGWVTSTVLVAAVATNDLGLWPRQSDQRPGRDWLAPDNPDDDPDPVAEVIQSSSGYSFGYGNPTLTWHLRGLTPLMVAWILANRFSGGVWTAQATIKIPHVRSTGGALYYQALATRTLYSTAELALGGLDRWAIAFVNCTGIAAP